MPFMPLAKLHPRRLKRSLTKKIKILRARTWPQDYGVARHGGLLWLLNRKNRVDRKVIGGGYEEEQLAFLFSHMEKGCDVFIDAGANFGLYSLLTAKSGHAKEIHAFEADPRNYAQLQANLYLNGLTGTVTAHPEALSDKEGTVSFELYPASTTGQSRIGDAPSAVRVPAITLDSALALQGKRVFIKMDVEGHELQVLAGAAQLLKNNFCFLQIEAFIKNVPALTALLEAAGLRLIHKIGVDYYFTNI